MKLKLPLYICLSLAAGFSYSNGWCQGGIIIDTSAQENLTKAANLKTVKDNELFFDALKAKSHNDSKHARELLEQYVAVQPQSAAAYYELSRLYIEDKKIDKSEISIKKAVALVKDNKWYNEEYATILAVQGKYDEAATMMAAIADKEPSDINYTITASEYFEKAKKYTEAVAYLEKALVRSGSDEEVLLHKVQLYLHMNEVDKAALVIRQLISQDARNGKYYKLLGELYDNNKMPEKALEVYKNAEKAAPGDPAIEMGLSEHFLNVRDTVSFRKYAKKAILNNKLDIDTQMELLAAYMQNMTDSAQIVEGLPMMKQLLSQHPLHAMLIATYGEYLIQNHQAEAGIAELKRSLALKQSNFTVWQDLLNAYSEKTYADSLIKYSEKAIRLFPNQALAHYFNAVGHYNKKEYPGAVKALNRAIDMFPETDAKGLCDMYSFLADIYNTSKQYSRSDSAFDKALEFVPGNATVLNNYSYFLSERGKNLDKAEEMSKKSLGIRPNEPTFLDTYGWILYKKGEYEEAKNNIEKAVNANLQKADGALYDHLGDVYFKLNDKVKALQYWKKAKEKGSENPMLDKKISEGKLYE